MKLKYLHLLIIALLFSMNANAQISSVPQFINAPLQLNPALTGDNHKNIRLAYSLRQASYKNGSTRMFSSASADKRLGNFGVGIITSSDDLGGSGITQKSHLVSFASHFETGSLNSNIISIGIHAGTYRKVFNPENYDASTVATSSNVLPGQSLEMSISDPTRQQTIILPNAGLGLSWKFHYGQKGDEGFTQETGMVLSNLPQGNGSFNPELPSPVSVKQLVYTKSGVFINSKLQMQAMILYWNQGMLSETTMGLMFNYDLKYENEVSLGVVNNVGTGSSIYGSARLGSFSFGMGYNFANSSLNEVNGAMQLNFAYIPVMGRSKNLSAKARKVPGRLAKAKTRAMMKRREYYPSVRNLN